MKITDLLEAIDLNKTLVAYKDKLKARRPKEASPEEVVKAAISSLSQQQQKFSLVKWMLDHYISGDIKRYEDFGRAANAMHVVSTRGRGIDINRLNFDQLETKAEEISRIPSKKDKRSKEKEEISDDIRTICTSSYHPTGGSSSSTYHQLSSWTRRTTPLNLMDSTRSTHGSSERH